MEPQEENTKLIAEFMGLKQSDELYKDHFTYVGDDIKKAGLPFENIMGNCMHKLPFNTSWDWLMPVVKKCYNNMDVADGQDTDVVGDISYASLDCDINKTYKAVIEFIKYYNH